MIMNTINNMDSLTKEQMMFIDMALSGRNCTLLAPAGYGKSHVIATLVSIMKEQEKKVSVVAPTGRAALIVKGRTIHSFLGIGLGKGNHQDWYDKVISNRFKAGVISELRQTNTIIIDEISMVSNVFFSKIDAYLQLIRSNFQEPFGGIQMILVGDLYQLSPVENDFIFKSESFENLNSSLHQFTKCFRQEDPKFLELLNHARFSELNDSDINILQECTSIDPELIKGDMPTKLYATNREVDLMNQRELKKLCEQKGISPQIYEPKWEGRPSEAQKGFYRGMCNQYNIDDKLQLAVGAQVVVTYNISQIIVNGTQGTIVNLTPSKVIIRKLGSTELFEIEYIEFKDPEHNNKRTEPKTLFQYIPLKLGWAMTVHKSQGMTIKFLEIDFKSMFTHGQAYVALSRVQSLDGLIVQNICKEAFICRHDVRKFCETKCA